MKPGQRIKLFAKTMGWTVKELADKLSMSAPALHSYLSGRSNPGSEILMKLLDLGCNINWLLTGESEVLYKNIHVDDNLVEELMFINERLTELLDDPKEAKSFLDNEMKKYGPKIYEVLEILYKIDEALLKQKR